LGHSSTPAGVVTTTVDAERTGWLARLPSIGPAALVLVGVAYALAYIGSASAVRTFAPPGGFSPWYPPAGLMMALLLLAGPRWVVWAIAVRVVTISVVVPSAWTRDPAAVIGRAVVIGACYALAAATLRAVRIDKAHAREFGWFAAIAVAAAPLTAALGVAAIDAGEDNTRVIDELISARVFWVGDALAIAAIVPAALLIAFALRFGRPRIHLPTSPVRRAAAVVFLVPLAVVGGLGRQPSPMTLLLAVLPLLWVALRQDLLVAACGVLVTTAVAASAMRATPSNDDLLQMQMVLLTGALAALLCGRRAAYA
jgi:integral membrane sensor domain MASE1